MKIRMERADTTLVVEVDGRIDGVTAPEFEDTIKTAASESDRAVIVGFEGVSYISSAGLRAVLLIAKDLSRRDAKFALYALESLVREVFEISGFDHIIQIHPNKAEAIAATGD